MLSVSLYGTLRVAFKARESATSGHPPAMRSSSIALDLVGAGFWSRAAANGIAAGAFLGSTWEMMQVSQDTIEFYCIGTSDSLDPPKLRRIP